MQDAGDCGPDVMVIYNVSITTDMLQVLNLFFVIYFYFKICFQFSLTVIPFQAHAPILAIPNMDSRSMYFNLTDALRDQNGSVVSAVHDNPHAIRHSLVYQVNAHSKIA